jgi:YidC/Oxa1 family membrane protein insertase
MDKRTLLAIILSVVVVSGSFVLQNIFFPPKPAAEVAQPAAVKPGEAPVVPAGTPTPATPALSGDKALQAAAVEIPAKTVTLENNVMRVTFSNEGAVATSIELKKHLEKGKPVQMVNRDKGVGAAFETSFGGFEADALTLPFEVSQTGPLGWKFSRPFVDKNGGLFTLTKTFSVQPDEYLIKVEVAIASANGSLPVLSADSSAYTLTYGPQLGPHFTKIDGSQEIRKYYKFNGADRSEDGLNLETKSTDANLKWAAMTGKYFTVIGIPDSTAYKTVFSNKHRTGDTEVSRLAFTRPALKSSTTVDTFYFYVGPKEESALKKYDASGDNSFGLSGLKLERAMEDNFLLGWLEVILKWVLQAFYLVLPNWGVAIILLTVLIKLATWPLTAKSYRANAAMQTLQPKLKELQEKYKDDPKKLNEQTMGLYQKEGVNPLGGCLPMLLQIPVFFALYSLFNTQFDLRGAMFIPGWIPDLSLPDSVFHWGFALPLLNWTDLRILPFVMVGTQVWTSALSQPTGGMNTQMKIMTFGLPFMFFFMLYEMPSGLMVYWCVQNILTVVQQGYINKHFKKVPAKTGNPNLKLAPKKSGKKLSK